MSESLVQPLFDGPVDIVGDVHGELKALQSLGKHLGYDADWRHPDGRRLIFVGDLTDRGECSPKVVDLVQRLVKDGLAQCVLGNHELNILLNHPKHENKWFYGEKFVDGGKVIKQEFADYSTRKQVLDFFATLPLALERDDLRVVHACWSDDMLSFARESSNVVLLYHQHADRIECDARNQPTIDAIDKGLLHQNKNPVKLLTSGRETRSAEPFEAGGKIKHERRVLWWNDYQDVFCVFGHYAIPDGEPRGNGSAFCVDFGVGKRWTERRDGKSSGFSCKLAALRFPEKVVVFDDGSKESIAPSWEPGGGVVLDVHPATQDWELPSDDAVTLTSFHVTLIGRKVFLERQEAMADVWESVRPTLPLPPQPEVGKSVDLATDDDRKTWYLPVVNQHEFRAYVQQLTSILDEAFRQRTGSGFSNPETDRYFHMSVANNQGGDPLKSIGSIKPPNEV